MMEDEIADVHVDELEPEDRMRLQRFLIAFLDLMQAPIGCDEKAFRRLLLARGFNVTSSEEAVRH